MNALQDKAAIATGASAEIPVVVTRQSKRKKIGILLCIGAVVVLAGGWALALTSGATSTDNAYVRGDVTSLAAKVAGYVTAVEVEDNQTVRAGAGGWRPEFLDLAGLGVDAAKHVGVLAGIPEIAVARRQRIVRARADGGYGPFLETHFHGAGNDYGLGDVALGKTLREVVNDGGYLVLGNVGAGGDHALDDQLPVGGRVPGAGDEVERVARGAGSLDDGLWGLGKSR